MVGAVDSEGVTALYDALSDEVKAALQLRRRLARRKFSFGSRWAVPTLPINPTKPPQEGWRQGIIDAATDQERTSPLFSCVTASYWVEELAQHLSQQFALDSDRLKALGKIQEIRERQLRALPRWLSFTAVATVLITVVGFIASQVPKETFGALGLSGDDYGWYRLVLLGLLLCLLIAVAPLIVLRAQLSRIAGDKHVVFITGLVLTYSGILVPPESPAAHADTSAAES